MGYCHLTRKIDENRLEIAVQSGPGSWNFEINDKHHRSCGTENILAETSQIGRGLILQQKTNARDGEKTVNKSGTAGTAPHNWHVQYLSAKF